MPVGRLCVVPSVTQNAKWHAICLDKKSCRNVKQQTNNNNSNHEASHQLLLVLKCPKYIEETAIFSLKKPLNLVW